MLIYKCVIKIIIILILIVQSLIAQKFDNSISGYIIDNITAEPIESVNVYLANTTFGSSTDKDGFYIIKSIPPNIHELIVSVLGYNTLEQKLLVTKSSNIKHNFVLRPIIYEWPAIDITSTIPEQWLKNLKTFKDKFLGQSFRSEECLMLNPEVLNFRNESNILFASIEKPLIIINQNLGYKIYCNSLDFQYSGIRNTWSWAIKPRFEELPSGDSLQILRWKINRQIAYFGSMYHFLMSLKQNKLPEEDYSIFVSDKPLKFLSMEHNPVFKANIDSIKQPGIDKRYHKIKSNKFLLIKNHSIDDHFSFTDDFSAEFGETYQESWLKLKYGEMTIDEYGYPVEDDAFIVYGYWATLGVADLLPRYYNFKN